MEYGSVFQESYSTDKTGSCRATTKNRQHFDINCKRIPISMRLLSQVERSGSTWVNVSLFLDPDGVWSRREYEDQRVVRFYNVVVNESLHNTKFNCRSQLLTFSYIFIYSFIITSNNFFFQLSISLSCCPKTSPMFNASGVFHVQLQIWKERNKKVLWIFFVK